MKKVFSLLLLLFPPILLFGQLMPVTDQYLLNPMTINPAYAGSRSALCMTLSYRNQWIGMNGAPETGTFSVDAPLRREKIGLGLMVVADKIGVTKEKQVMSSYAYKVGLGDGILSMGLGANLIMTNSVWSDLQTNDDIGDAAFLVDSRTFFVPNFRFGLYYTFKNYYAGFSVPQFLSYSFDFERNKYALHSDIRQYNFLFNTGYTFMLSRKVNFIPSVLLSYMASERLAFDVTTQFSLSERIWLGASYNSSKLLTSIFQAQLNNQIGFGYMYKYDLGKLGKYNGGSHEIMLRYEFHYKIDAINPLNF